MRGLVVVSLLLLGESLVVILLLVLVLGSIEELVGCG